MFVWTSIRVEVVVTYHSVRTSWWSPLKRLEERPDLGSREQSNATRPSPSTLLKEVRFLTQHSLLVCLAIHDSNSWQYKD